MGDEVRFHLDEHVNHAIAIALRDAGIDVTTTVDRSMCGLDDELQFNFSQSDGRVFVTDDGDFFKLARPPKPCRHCLLPTEEQFNR